MRSPAKTGQNKGRPSARAPESRPRPAAPAASLLSRFVLATVALCALVLIAYGNSIGNGFVWDDHEQIVMNPRLKAHAPLAPLLTSDARFSSRTQSIETSAYRPLQMLTYRALAGSFDATPAAFHVCSVAFALLGTLAAFAMFWLLTRKLAIAFAAAALFAVYPIHTETVDWIAALPDLGLGLFTLLAFALFLAGRNAASRTRNTGPSLAARWLFPACSLLAYAIALLWKETAVIFPVLIAAYAVLLEAVSPDVAGVGFASRARAALKESAAYWIVLAAYLALRLRALGAFKPGSRDWALTPLQLLLTALHLILAYWAKLALPIRLDAYYVFSPLRSLDDLRAVTTILLTLAAVAVLVYLLRRATLAGFAALWVTITLIPALNIYALGRNVFTERYLYLPSAGFCLLLVLAASWLLQRLPAKLRTPASAVLLLLVLAGFTAETIERNPDWKDDSTLFAQTLRLSPGAPFVRFMVATGQSSQPSEAASAEANYLQAIALAQQQIPPDRLDLVNSYEGLAWLYADRQQAGQALQLLARVHQIAPVDADADGEEGLILARAGRGSEAKALLERTLAAQPNNENVLSALAAIARDDDHDLNRAAALFSKALAIHAQDDDFRASLQNNLGGVYGEQGNFAAAIEHFQPAVGTSPADPEYRVNLANALAAAGRIPEARAEAEAALRLAPSDPAARDIVQRLRSPGR